MVGSRFAGIALLTLGMGVAVSQTGRSHSPGAVNVPWSARPALPQSSLVCALYPLADFDDPNLAKWIADTIPQVIEPRTWGAVWDGKAGGKPMLSYYAPAKLLLVAHTPAVQAKVDAFIKNVKKSLPAPSAKRAPRQDGAVMPAQFVMPPGSVIPAANAPAQTGPAKVEGTHIAPESGWGRPKHLFHFIIRYEGEGIIDSTVADVLKAIYLPKAEQEASPITPPAAPVTPATPEEKTPINEKAPRPETGPVPQPLQTSPVPQPVPAPTVVPAPYTPTGR